MELFKKFRLFDSHFHIIDPKFPLVKNQGYLPDYFTIEDYFKRIKKYNVRGGAIVSASFQAFDQSYLISALKKLGPSFIGVTQIPATISDKELLKLNKAGVKAVRFNLKRGGSEYVKNLKKLAERVYETVGWHTELYIDSKDLPELHETLIKLPSVSIDHLGLSKAGLPNLLALVEKGIIVKASGFSRTDLNIKTVIQKIVKINPNALIFGTDLPSTRALLPYSDNNFLMVINTLGEKMAKQIFYKNAIDFYKPKKIQI
ncbi:MAG: amidohydrolase family protein [bacterium]|nr:amidohydrolase family protein [bacterium]